MSSNNLNNSDNSDNSDSDASSESSSVGVPVHVDIDIEIDPDVMDDIEAILEEEANALDDEVDEVDGVDEVDEPDPEMDVSASVGDEESEDEPDEVENSGAHNYELFREEQEDMGEEMTIHVKGMEYETDVKFRKGETVGDLQEKILNAFRLIPYNIEYIYFINEDKDGDDVRIIFGSDDAPFHAKLSNMPFVLPDDGLVIKPDNPEARDHTYVNMFITYQNTKEDEKMAKQMQSSLYGSRGFGGRRHMFGNTLFGRGSRVRPVGLVTMNPSDLMNVMRGNPAPIFGGTVGTSTGSVPIGSDEATGGEPAPVEASGGSVPVGTSGGGDPAEAGTPDLTNLENIGRNFAERMLSSMYGGLSDEDRAHISSSLRSSFTGVGGSLAGDSGGTSEVTTVVGGGDTGLPETSISFSTSDGASLGGLSSAGSARFGSLAQTLLSAIGGAGFGTGVGAGGIMTGEDVKVVVDEKELETFKKIKYDDLKKGVEENGIDEGAGAEEDEEEACVICMCEYDGDDEVMIMPNCKHFFHTDCINKWLGENSNKCPICKAECGTGKPLL